MARHYLDAYPVDGGKIEIPVPAVDMATGRGRFGSSGSYLSGGAYVRKSLYGARNFNVSWNNLNTDGMNRILQLEEAGSFVWDNPMAYRNVALPWLANHGNVQGSVNFLGTTQNYIIKSPSITEASINSIAGAFDGYPQESGNRTPTIRYRINRYESTDLMYFVLPEGYDCYVWVVGQSVPSGPNITIRRADNTGGSTIVVPQSPTNNTLPTAATQVTFGAELLKIRLTGSGGGDESFRYLDLSSIQIRIVPQGQPVGPLTYSPGLGTSALEFTEEGIDIVQHSAALDMQSATATWLETGWWK